MISGAVIVQALIFLICLGMVFWLLWWLLAYVNPPEPFKKVGNVILAIAAVIVLINVLMTLAGHPIVKW
jgi:hypothetical protein